MAPPPVDSGWKMPEVEPQPELGPAPGIEVLIAGTVVIRKR
jgi:hypothetical protein